MLLFFVKTVFGGIFTLFYGVKIQGNERQMLFFGGNSVFKRYFDKIYALFGVSSFLPKTMVV